MINKARFQAHQGAISLCLLGLYFIVNGFINSTTVLMEAMRTPPLPFAQWEPFVWEYTSAFSSFCVVMVVGSFVWFFGSADRNINDYEGGLDAPTQALFFFLGALAGVGLTLTVSSLINLRLNGVAQSRDAGLDALRDSSYFRALSHSLVYWWREWRTQTKNYFSG